MIRCSSAESLDMVQHRFPKQPNVTEETSSFATSILKGAHRKRCWAINRCKAKQKPSNPGGGLQAANPPGKEWCLFCYCSFLVGSGFFWGGKGKVMIYLKDFLKLGRNRHGLEDFLEIRKSKVAYTLYPEITEDSPGFPNIKPLYYTVISLANWDWTVVCTWITSSCGPKQKAYRYQRKERRDECHRTALKKQKTSRVFEHNKHQSHSRSDNTKLKTAVRKKCKLSNSRIKPFGQTIHPLFKKFTTNVSSCYLHNPERWRLKTWKPTSVLEGGLVAWFSHWCIWDLCEV